MKSDIEIGFEKTMNVRRDDRIKRKLIGICW
jgi:hypothetical protein